MPARVGLELIWEPSPQIFAEGYFMAADRAQQLQEPMHEAVQIYSEEIQANFAAQGRPDPWAPLAPDTIKQKETSFFGMMGQILVATGDLESQATSEGSWAISGSGQNMLASLEGVPGYGLFHVTGTMFMPARDWTYVSPDAVEKIYETFSTWVFGG